LGLKEVFPQGKSMAAMGFARRELSSGFAAAVFALGFAATGWSTVR
jgi:hypothetical protein